MLWKAWILFRASLRPCEVRRAVVHRCAVPVESCLVVSLRSLATKRHASKLGDERRLHHNSNISLIAPMLPSCSPSNTSTAEPQAGKPGVTVVESLLARARYAQAWRGSRGHVAITDAGFIGVIARVFLEVDRPTWGSTGG